MTPDDRAKIERGAIRFIHVHKTHGELVHDAIADHMSEWLLEHGYDDSLEVMAHVAGNVTEDQWNAVVAKAVSQLKAAGNA